jgi:hypothetical protein
MAVRGTYGVPGKQYMQRQPPQNIVYYLKINGPPGNLDSSIAASASGKQKLYLGPMAAISWNAI